MTMTTPPSAIQRIRATRGLPPPARRRQIREEAGLSREDIARELRAKGLRVTEGAVKWWEMEPADGGFTPRPGTAVAYKNLLERIQRELDAWRGRPGDYVA